MNNEKLIKQVIDYTIIFQKLVKNSWNKIKEVVNKRLLKEGELLDYEKLSRKRYMDFYLILSEGTEKDQLSVCGEKDSALGELYPEIFSAYTGLRLTTELEFEA